MKSVVRVLFGQKENVSITGTIIIIAIILLLYLTPLISVVSATDKNLYATLMYLYAASSYTIIVVGIFILHLVGVRLFSNHLTLWTIVLTCFLRLNFGGSYVSLYQGYMNFLGFVLILFVITNWRNIEVPKLKTAFAGLLWTSCTIALMVTFQALLSPARGVPPSDLWAYIVNTSLFQLSFITVIEESCFRGLLFGFLVMKGFKENSAFLIQGILFWGIHYLKIDNPILFFVLIPIFTISATLLMKKYRLLFNTILMHTLNNVFSALLVAYL